MLCCSVVLCLCRVTICKNFLTIVKSHHGAPAAVAIALISAARPKQCARLGCKILASPVKFVLERRISEQDEKRLLTFSLSQWKDIVARFVGWMNMDLLQLIGRCVVEDVQF